jgi:adenine phosphoribosyltransferase
MANRPVDLAGLIRTIPDFPKPGIQFRDITTLLLDADGFAATVEQLAACVPQDTDLIAGIEARGFVIGAALGQRLGKGLILIRKDGKLPGATIAEEYALEYGTDRLSMHVDACAPGARVMIVDDLIATGGTAMAALRLVQRCGALPVGACFVIDLPDLGGADRLRELGLPVTHLVSFAGH